MSLQYSQDRVSRRSTGIAGTAGVAPYAGKAGGSPAVGSSAPTGGRRRDATANRETLLAAAQSVLAEQSTASLDAIAQAAGLTRRALYGHFPDRDALLHEVIAVGARQFRDIASAAADEDPRVALAQLASRLWNAAPAVRASAHLATTEAYAEATAQALAPLRRRLTLLTQQGVGSGAFRRDMSPELLAFLIEESARATLRERRVAEKAGVETAIKVVLSIVGLSWQEQDELLAMHPAILRDAAGTAHSTPRSEQ